MLPFTCVYWLFAISLFVAFLVLRRLVTPPLLNPATPIIILLYPSQKFCPDIIHVVQKADMTTANSLDLGVLVSGSQVFRPRLRGFFIPWTPY